MPHISFAVEKNIKSIEVDTGTNLMQGLLNAGRPVASSCFGKGICSKCRLQILKGDENLSQETDSIRALRARHSIQDGYRLACQTQILGDVTVDTTYW